MKICKISHAFSQTTGQSFFKIYITPHYHERQLLCTFVAQTIYTLVTRRQLKKTFFDFLSALVKFCEVHVNFKMTCQFLFNFCIILHCHDTRLHCKFKAHTFSTWTKGSYQSSNFDTSDCSGENLQNSCQFPSNKSIFLQISHHSSMS